MAIILGGLEAQFTLKTSPPVESAPNVALCAWLGGTRLMGRMDQQGLREENVGCFCPGNVKVLAMDRPVAWGLWAQRESLLPDG